MFKNKTNIKRIVATSLASVVILSTAAFAASKVYTKQIPATYGRIKFNYNGVDVTQDIESKYGTPAFISGDRSYAPVRAIADLVGVNVRWDAATYTAYLTSNTTNTTLLEQQVTMLKAENETLKQKLKDGGSSDSDKSISDLEKQLRKDYGTYERIDFDISLSGNSKRADLKITTNLGSSRNRDNWNDLSERDRERFIEKVVADIQREYRDCDVDGYLRDSDSRDDLYTFRKDGSRSIDFKSKSGSNMKDVEKRLNKDHDRLGDIKNIEFTVKEDGKDSYIVTGDINYSKYEDAWDEMKDDKIEDYMDEVQRTASKEISGRPDIEVELKDNRSLMASYSRNGKFTRKYGYRK